MALPAALLFEPNHGQTDASVRFLARTATGAVFVTDSGLVFSKNNQPVTIGFPGGRKPWIGEEPTGNVTHYFIGRDRSKWVHGIPSYGRLVRKDISPGIDLVLYGNARNELEYDLIVSPGADPSQIQIEVPVDAQIDSTTGDLTMAGGAVRQRRPVILQGERVITGRIRQRGPGRFGFEIGDYDRSQPLTIDPVIESREYLGGIGNDAVTGFSASATVGTTTSIDFPGASIQKRHGTDVFVKINEAAWVIGGSGNEVSGASQSPSSSIGEIFVGGTTDSRDLPTDSLSFQREFQGGGSDGFLIRVDARQAARIFTTYFGTPGDDRISATTGSGTSFAIAGSTNGSALPPATVQTNLNSPAGGGMDGFAAFGTWFSVSSALFNLTARLGGSGEDEALGVAIRPSEIVVVGETKSNNFLGGALPRRGPSDGFLVRIRTTTGELLASKLLGGSGSDKITAVSNRFNDNTLFVVGSTTSTDFPLVTPSQSAYGGGTSDAIVAVYSWDLESLRHSTFLGGSASDEGTSIQAGTFNFFAGGRTSSTDFPVFDAVQARYGGGASDGFAFHAEASGKRIQSTYYGGSGMDEVLAVDGGDVSARIGGVTTSTDLPGDGPPVVTGEPRPAGSTDGFVAVISSTILAMPARVTAAKYTWASVPILVGDRGALSRGGRANIRSSDTGRVLVAAFGGEPVSEDVVVWPPGGGGVSLRAFCLTDSGSATVTVSIPGYADRSTTVYCAQPNLSLSLGGFASTSAAERGEVALTGRLNGSVSVRALDTESGFLVICDASRSTQYPFPLISISNSGPAVLAVTDGAGTQTSSVFPQDSISIRPLAMGLSTVTVSAPGAVSGSRSLQVTGSFDTSELTIGAGLTRWLGITPSFKEVTVRSLDPDKLLLSLSSAHPAVASVTGGFSSYQIRAMAGVPAGSVARLEISTTDGAERVVRNVRFIVPAISLFSDPAQEVVVPVGFDVGISLRTNGGDPLSVVPVSFSYSNPTVAATVGSASIGSTFIRGLSVGTSTLSIQPPTGYVLASGWDGTVRIRVVPATLTVKAFDLGAGLIEFVQVSLPDVLPSARTVTVSTSTPALLQVAELLGTSPFGERFSTTLDRVPSMAFRAKGLASSGTGRVTIEVSGLAPVTVDVTLRPAGFLWTAQNLSLPASFLAGAPFSVAAIDSVSGLPLVRQTPADASIVPVIENSNPAVATYGSNGLITAVAAGTTELSIRQPPGFVAPTIRQRLRVTVVPLDAPATSASLRLEIMGSGSIAGPPNCAGPVCAELVPLRRQLSLRAVPAVGQRFVEWSGDGPCSGSLDPVCSFAMAGAVRHVAVFAPTAGAMQFVPVPPCRLVDTRFANAALGSPALQGLVTRNFPVRSACNLPVNAAAYSLNVTVVPRGQLGYLSIWPGGQPQPTVSTLNSLDGRVKANAAIVPVGPDGSVNVFATDTTDVILDVNGAFVPAGSNPAGQAFFSVTPCRIADTRFHPDGPLRPLTDRVFRVSGLCNVPSGVTAYVLNVTAVPKRSLGYVTLWPNNGSARPTVSTLNAVTGTVTANAAIVPSGTGGEIRAFATEDTDLVLDITGYFADPNQRNALNFFAVNPCRVLDTRLTTGPLGGPELGAVSNRAFGMPASACGVPPAARAFALNATVVPPALLGYLTLYATGFGLPTVSTLNAVDASITSNAAIVPAGISGGISAFVTERTHMILDINGYFAP